MSHRKTTDEFIEECKRLYNDKFDYSKTCYKTAKEKVIITCKVHGDFLIAPEKFLLGKGCPKCNIQKRAKQQMLKYETFLEKANKIHDRYYEYTTPQNWGGLNTIIEITCPKHGVFKQYAKKHLLGQGCPECGREKTISASTKTYEEFLEKANKIHNNYYQYDANTYTTRKNKIGIICPKHGIFFQEAQSHLQGHGCPQCSQSHLENVIATCLTQENIQFIKQYFINGQFLDFYLPDYNIGIECQGEQHFKEKFVFRKHYSNNSDFKTIIERDIRKKHYCQEHNINLLYFSKKSWLPKNIKDDIYGGIYDKIYTDTNELVQKISGYN